MRKHFMTKENDENFESSTKCQIFYNNFVVDDVKITDN